MQGISFQMRCLIYLEDTPDIALSNLLCPIYDICSHMVPNCPIYLKGTPEATDIELSNLRMACPYMVSTLPG